MHTIKPLQLSVLHKTFVWDERPRFAVSLLLGFPIGGGEPLLEQDLWRLLADQIGSDGMLDMGMPKPRGEVLVYGSFHAPGGQPVTAGQVTLKAGPIDKELAVIGDRYWRALLGPTEPLPIKTLPIRYDYAFGGQDFDRNPSGRGLDEVDVFGEMRRPLPNIEDPRHLVTSAGHRPDPAGFGPLDIMWAYRARKVGTYDDKWLKERAPGYAEDLDWTHFNAAPPDQWLPGFFEGTEGFSLEYMHPEKPLLSGRLPDLRTRCFVNRRTDGELRFEEIDTHPETLFLFPEVETAILLYRGTLNIGQDDASDIEHLVLAYEKGAEAPRSRDHYLAAMNGRLDPKTQMRYMLSTVDLIADGHICGYARMLADTPPPATAMMDNMQNKADAIKQDALDQLEQQKQELEAALKAAGVDPGPYLDKMQLDPKAADADPAMAELMQLLEEMLPGVNGEPQDLDLAKLDLGKLEDINRKMLEMAETKKQEVRDQLQQQLTEMEQVPGGEEAADKLRDAIGRLDEPPDLPRAPGPELADSLRRQVEDVKATRERLRQQGVAEEQLPSIDIDVEETLARMAEGGERIKEVYRMGAHHMDKGKPPHTDPLDVVAHRLLKALDKGESVAGGDYAGIDLSGRDLSGVDLSEAYLEDVDFGGARLRGANLRGAIAARANFAGADLAGADLSGANIGAAAFQDADLTGANLENAVIGKARFTRARMNGARLLGMQDMLETEFAHAVLDDALIQGGVFLELDLSGARFVGAELPEANLIKCRLEEANFNSAALDACNFVECEMPRAHFEQARLVNTRFLSGCDLTQTRFDGANLDKSNFREARMQGASLRGTSINMADFGEANLEDASFAGAVGVRSQFIKTDLAKADIGTANLMEANLMKARLTSAKFESANLYSAEFMGAVVGGTSFLAANLDLTKIEDWRPE